MKRQSPLQQSMRTAPCLFLQLASLTCSYSPKEWTTRTHLALWLDVADFSSYLYSRPFFWTPPDLHCQSNQRAFSCNRGSPRLIPASVDEADVLLYLYMPYWLPFGLYLYSPSGRPSGLLSVLCTLYRASHTPFGLPYGLRTVTEP